MSKPSIASLKTIAQTDTKGYKLAPNNSRSGGVARTTGTEYFAYYDTALALMPERSGGSTNVIALQRNPGDRCWRVRFNGYPSFSISHSQLLSRTRFVNVAVRQLTSRRCSFERFLFDLLALPEDGRVDIMERLIANLPAAGGGK